MSTRYPYRSVQTQPAGRGQWWGLGGLLAAGFAACLAVAFGAGYLLAERNAPTNNELRTLWEAWQIAERDFYYTVPEDSDRVQAAAQGMLSTLNDPYTLLLPPVEASASQAVLQGETGGIGATVGTNEQGRLVVMEVRIGSAAELAGVLPGDVILSVDGKSTEGEDANVTLSRVRGLLGTEVTITVGREGVDDPIEFIMKRAQINVYGRLLDDGNAYLSMAIFSSDSPTLLTAELNKLLAQNPRGLILDLRGNPGGYLTEAITIADLFLPTGTVVSERNSAGNSKVFSSDDGDPGEQIPMVVLVNNGSASASEIVAGALQDRKRAALIGEKTYGKGSVQSLYELSDGSQLRVTNAAWYTPNETPLQGVGLTPDLSINSEGAQSDVVLEAAQKYLNEGAPVVTLIG